LFIVISAYNASIIVIWMITTIFVGVAYSRGMITLVAAVIVSICVALGDGDNILIVVSWRVFILDSNIIIIIIIIYITF